MAQKILNPNRTVCTLSDHFEAKQIPSVQPDVENLNDAAEEEKKDHNEAKNVTDVATFFVQIEMDKNKNDRHKYFKCRLCDDTTKYRNDRMIEHFLRQHPSKALSEKQADIELR